MTTALRSPHRAAAPGRSARAPLVALALAAVGASLAAQAPEAPAPYVPRPLAALRADSAALLLSGGEGGPVRLALLALPGYRANGAPRLFLYAELAGESLLRDAPPGPLGVELSAYVLDGEGKVVTHASEGIRLPPPEERAALAGSGLRYATAFDVPPGDYSVRLLAKLRPSGGFGLRATQVRLASAARPGGPGTPLLAIPIWPASSGPWIDVRSPSLAADEPPHLPGGGWPSAFPVRALDPKITLRLAVPQKTRPAATLPARLAPFAGGEERIVAIEVGSASSPLGGGLEAIDATLDAEDAPPGGYALRVASEADPAGRGAVRLVLLRPAAGERLPSSWIAATRSGSSPSSAAASTAQVEPEPPAERRAEREQEVARLRAGLARGFRLVADGDLDGATSALLAIETAVLERTPRRALTWIEEAHTQLRKAVIATDPETLLPLSTAYAELAEKAALARRPALSRLAQETAAELAEEYAKRSRGEGASALAARTAFALAGRLYDLGSPRRAQRLLDQADSLDPGDGTAARLAAFIDERHDAREEAARRLRRLLERRPTDREARLRLALCDLALGESGGLKALRTLVAEPGADWVGAVAAQELVRRDLADRRFDEAAQRAREALRRLPGDPGLRLQLSWALQQSGHPGDALAALDPLLSAASVAPPRRRYSAWPRETFREARREAEQAAQTRLRALHEALSRLPEGMLTDDAKGSR